MAVLILVYSRSGNNALLARALAARLNARIEEVRPRGWYPLLRMIWQMRRGTRPRIRPLGVDPAAFEQVLVMAPLWDMKLAFPMAQALGQHRDTIGRYDFVTLCGDQRDGQPDAVRAELAALVGHPPVHQMELHVGDLLPAKARENVMKFSGHRVTEAELCRFDSQIDQIAAWYAP